MVQRSILTNSYILTQCNLAIVLHNKTTDQCACLLSLLPQDSSDSEDEAVHDGSRRKTLFETLETIIDKVKIIASHRLKSVVWSLICVLFGHS